ncbi:MAG: LysE family transporter [Dehalococcoidia bacterium]|nr:LysE family transporter [Dehalococcoidia bacterium]
MGLGLFLLSAAGISLTGAMMPGPLTAAVVSKGYGDRDAGVAVAVGHGIVELPLIAAIYFGFGHFLTSPSVINIISVGGGLMLIYLGLRMFRTSNRMLGMPDGLPHSLVVTGIFTTGTNPYFFVWWATVGMALIAAAAEFGIVGVALFILVHWGCDLACDEFISFVTFRSREWWTQKTFKVISSICALILIGFGVWFCLSVFV